MVFAASSLCVYNFIHENITVHVANRRVRGARQHCIVPRLESHAVLQISRVYKTKLQESSQAVMKSLWSVSVCIRSSFHTPVCLTPGLQETSHRREGRGGGGGGRRQSIHQPSSECSVWACCDGRRAGTELPKTSLYLP